MHPIDLLPLYAGPVPQAQMPRVSGLTSRAKKKKVEWLANIAVEEAGVATKADGAQERGVSPTCGMQLQSNAMPPPRSPGALKRQDQEAADLFHSTMEVWEAAEEAANEARAKHRMVKCLVDAKEKHMEASEARDRKRKKPLKNSWGRRAQGLGEHHRGP